MIQPSLVVGAAGDRHEREADAVADQIMRRLQLGEVSAGDAAIRRQHSGAVVGLEGGAVDKVTTDRIETALGRGSTLPGDVQRAMEGAFGADFSTVRVHDDANSHQANVRLSARAFTTGNDIFFGKGAYRPSAAEGTRLLAHELTHVVQQGGAGTTRRSTSHRPGRRVQRALKYGTDPKTMIQPADKDLLYGINIPRGQTKGGLSDAQRDTLRTIDDYNRAIGINGIMTNAGSAMGLYDVRAELASAAAWGLPMDPALNTATNSAAIQLWITELRNKAAHIGLEDLGQSGGLLSSAKIDKKGRFKKNRAESQANQPKADQLTSKDTRRFLSPNHTKVTAQVEYDAMSAAKQTALNKWVYRAFFRRTSKLGQDFAIVTLGARVHFNTVADPDYKPLLGPQWLDNGLETMSKTGKNNKNRSITVSEHRHMKKLAKQYPAQFNVYGEI